MTVEIMKPILEKFEIDGNLIYVEPFGNGHINSTFAVYFSFENKSPIRYIVQKVNTTIFKKPEELMSNVLNVTDFLGKYISDNGGNPLRERITVVLSKDGKPFYCCENGDFYRVYHFIEDATCYQTVTKDLFYHSAKAFGRFAKSLDNFDASVLYDVIPNFHNTVNRYENFEISLKEDVKSRAKDCSEQIAFVQSRKDFCSVVTSEIETGAIPLRVCHNDTKLNNVMIDNETGVGICVIDLDTIMKGSLLYDFGDSIRFGASSALEDEEDLTKVFCDLEKYEMYVKGYLEDRKSVV